MTVDALSYTPDAVYEYDDVHAALDAPGVTWVRVADATDDEVADIEDAFGVHELVTATTVENDRANAQEFPLYSFLLLKTARLRPGETSFAEELASTPVGVFFGNDWVVTLSPRATRPVERVWTEVTGDEYDTDRGPDFLAYLIADEIVRGYYGVLDDIETQLEEIEDAIIETPDEATLESINNVRRELLSVRKFLGPAREAVGMLARGDVKHIRRENEKYFRDVHGTLVQLVELAETYRELASSARDIYLNSLSISTNEVMKRLTVVATIFIPLTFIVGVYGMNFEYMPELGWHYGYYAVWAAMAAVTVGLVAYFRRHGWL